MLEPVLGANEMAKVVFENNEYILRDDWSIDDVRNVIECNNIEEAESFTDDDCVRVLQRVAENFDANYGITWDSIDFVINQLIEESK
jgi:hypothetical protein